MVVVEAKTQIDYFDSEKSGFQPMLFMPCKLQLEIPLHALMV